MRKLIFKPLIHFSVTVTFQPEGELQQKSDFVICPVRLESTLARSSASAMTSPLPPLGHLTSLWTDRLRRQSTSSTYTKPEPQPWPTLYLLRVTEREAVALHSLHRGAKAGSSQRLGLASHVSFGIVQVDLWMILVCFSHMISVLTRNLSFLSKWNPLKMRHCRGKI